MNHGKLLRFPVFLYYTQISPSRARGPDGRNAKPAALPLREAAGSPFSYFAYSVLRVSRITFTRI